MLMMIQAWRFVGAPECITFLMSASFSIAVLKPLIPLFDIVPTGFKVVRGVVDGVVCGVVVGVVVGFFVSEFKKRDVARKEVKFRIRKKNLAKFKIAVFSSQFVVNIFYKMPLAYSLPPHPYRLGRQPP